MSDPAVAGTFACSRFRLRMMAIAAAMNTVEYVPLMIPTIIVNANPFSTSPPNR